MFFPRLINVFYTAMFALAICLSAQSCSSDEVDGKLGELVSEMNSSLPMTTDTIMRLENVSARKGHVLEYNYTITAEPGEVDYTVLQQKITKNLTDNAKNNPAMKAFRDDGVITEYHYKDENGKKLFDIRINAGDYK